MITYAIVLCLVFFFSYSAEKSCKRNININGSVAVNKTADTKIFLFVVIAVLVVTAGCRYYVGTDYGNYVISYEQEYSKLRWSDILKLDEPIFPMIGALSHKLFNSYFPMFFIASVISVGLMLYSTYKETTDYLFVSLLYLFAGGWVGTFNGVRQYLAVTIVFLGRRYISERKFWKFLLVCLVAFLAHKSALFFILVYFVYSEEFTPLRLLAVIIITVVVSRSYETIFDFIGWIKEEEFVADSYALRSVNILRILVGCAPAILAIYLAFTRKLDKQQIFYAYILVANAAIWIATADSAYLARLALYTGVFVPLGLNSVLKSCDERYRKLLHMIVILLYMFFWIYDILASSSLREFRWIFNYL